MDNSAGEIKIRVLPRKGEKLPEAAKSQSYRRLIFVATVAMLLTALGLMFKPTHKTSMRTAAVRGKTEKMDLASINARINDSVTRHLQDAEVQADLMKRTRELENEPFKAALKNDDDAVETLPEQEKKGYGVSLDSDNSSERVFEDLDANSQGYSDQLPADKINARIANRKWMREMERNEKIQFISAFIRSAYDKGYEVEIDQNLVVVGVKKLQQNKLLNIDQVIDRLAKGQ